MEAIREKAREVGRLIAQTDDYRAMRDATKRLTDDRDMVTLLNKVRDLQEGMTDSMRRGEEPGEEDQKAYEQMMEEMQAKPLYQAAIAAQSNMDKLMMQVNEEIANGIEAGEKSRIILS